MENKLNSYETMFIVSLANGEEAAKATVSKFTNLIAANAEVVQIDDWGKRRMAYPIQDMNEGYYTVATYKCNGEFPTELERLMNIDETVLRPMTIRLEYDAAERAAATPVAEETAVTEAPVAEEAPAADAE
jgi:small subunit ribosomal protein S6